MTRKRKPIEGGGKDEEKRGERGLMKAATWSTRRERKGGRRGKKEEGKGKGRVFNRLSLYRTHSR